MNLNKLADSTGKSVPFVMGMQRKFGLPVCKDYPTGYAVLLNKLIHLTICSVPDKKIKSLLDQERKLLELLKVDSLHAGSLWFEGLCTMNHGPTRLLLSGHDLGHPVECQAVQAGLDFGQREKELFQPAEMGASALKALQRYAEELKTVRERIGREIPALASALKWGRVVARPVDS